MSAQVKILMKFQHSHTHTIIKKKYDNTHTYYHNAILNQMALKISKAPTCTKSGVCLLLRYPSVQNLLSQLKIIEQAPLRKPAIEVEK